jgi:UDP-N-acetylenolpyruvoylglucosamine reductase
MNECSQKRWGSQPAAPSAGCIFKNPATVPTGRLVQELGLKGARRGGALISEVHGNFIVNEGNASARDILELIELVKETARKERGLELHTEVQIVGED